MKYYIYLLFSVIFTLINCTDLLAQSIESDELKSIDQVQKVEMPKQDNYKLYEDELKRRGPGIAPKFATNIEVVVSPETHGEWEELENGSSVWRLRIFSENAKSLNLGFSKYVMPAGGSLFIFPVDDPTSFIGPFTLSDNDDHEQLWTPVVDGEELVIELQIPSDKKNEVKLELKSVNHDFIGFSEMSQSGSCNLDVVCGSEDGWEIVDGYRDIIRSVAVISLGGGTFCSGFLINNANNDCTPFFMTAEHCGVTSGNAPSLVTYWNYENSECRAPFSAESGQNGDGELTQFNTGSILRAEWEPSDATLVELDDPVDVSSNPFFAGWSIEYLMPQDTVIGIHHPGTDEKRISFTFQATDPGTSGNQIVDIASATHVRVPDWDIGTTEGGSSGSPLFNKNKQVVGQLTGGGAACGNNLYDVYGWFYVSWIGGGTPATSLSFWLDPNDSGVETLNGRDCSYTVSANVVSQELCGIGDVEFTISTSESFSTDVDLTINDLPDGVTASFSVNPVTPGETSVLTVSNTSTVLNEEITINVAGSDGENSSTAMLIVKLVQEAPAMNTLLSPVDGSIDMDVVPKLSWEEEVDATGYIVEIATDVDFIDIVNTASDLTENEYNGTPLQSITTYFWRVKSFNICGEGPWSEVWSYTTSSCGASTATDVPVEISSGPAGTVTSSMFINSTGIINDINIVDLDLPHTYVGDLSATLESPSGTVVQLFDRPGAPDNGVAGCAADNIFVTFDDQATNTAADFESSCENTGIAISGSYQTIEALSTFNEESVNGEWILTVTDALGDDGGSINDWLLVFCLVEGGDLTMNTSEDDFTVCSGEEINFDLTLGGDFESTGVMLSATGLPDGSDIVFGNNPATPGETVNVNITNINTAGTYDITLVGEDGMNTNQSTITITVVDIPEETVLTEPLDVAVNVSVTPSFTWSENMAANAYDFILSLDDNFMNPIISQNTSINTYTVTESLVGETVYYWKVNSINDCGESSSNTFSFQTEMVDAITILDASTISVTPNPSSGLFTIKHNEAISYDENIEVFSIDGKMMKNYSLSSGESTLLIDLTEFTTGVYILKISNPKGILTKKLLIQM